MSERSIGDLFEDVLNEGDDLFDAYRQNSQPPAQPAAPAPTPARPALSGIDREIATVKSQIEALERRIQNARNEKAYQDANGQFDWMAMQADQTKVNALTRKLGDLREQKSEAKVASTQAFERAKQTMQRVYQDGVQTVDKRYHPALRQNYADAFRQLTQTGFWGKPEMQDVSKVREALDNIFNVALGKAMRNPGAAPEKEAGIEQADVQAPVQLSEEEAWEQELSQLPEGHPTRRTWEGYLKTKSQGGVLGGNLRR